MFYLHSIWEGKWRQGRVLAFIGVYCDLKCFISSQGIFMYTTSFAYPISQTRKIGPREVKWLVEGHLVKRWDLKLCPGHVAPRPPLFPQHHVQAHTKFPSYDWLCRGAGQIRPGHQQGRWPGQENSRKRYAEGSTGSSLSFSWTPCRLFCLYSSHITVLFSVKIFLL